MEPKEVYTTLNYVLLAFETIKAIRFDGSQSMVTDYELREWQAVEAFLKNLRAK